MKAKTKSFDCVGMKNRIQAEIVADYEKRKDQFASFAEYLKATESDWDRQVIRKLMGGASAASTG